MKDVKKQLASRLRELRGETTLYEVEKKTGVSRINLSRYEKGQHLPTEAVLKKLAKYYDVPYEVLRVLYYEDFYSTNLEERSIVLKWARELAE